MYSLRELYRIGLGPSSSHTMGPHYAAGTFKEKFPDAASYRVTLYGSLAATGKGHMTDQSIISALAPSKVEIIWKADTVLPFHTNGMLFEALDAESKVLGDWTAYSVGGGAVCDDSGTLEHYPVAYRRSSMNDIQKFIEHNGLTFWEYVEYHEGKEIWDYLAKVWEQMKAEVEAGLETDGVLPGELRLRSKAKMYHARATSLTDKLKSRSLVTSYALAAAETNARGGMVVTAPTCGSCGVMAGVLYHMWKNHDMKEKDILKAIATAGLFGNVIKENASISGAEVGCQGEVGSACAMAAVAVTELYGGTPGQIECAGEMAMEHNLGLTCDPVCGLVQIPCIERNAVAALQAMDVSLYAFLGDGKHMVSFDNIVKIMKETGHDLPSPYKETAQAGLATVIGK